MTQKKTDTEQETQGEHDTTHEHAAAATLQVSTTPVTIEDGNSDQDILQIEMTLDIFGPSTTITIPVTHHKQLGFIFYDGKSNNQRMQTRDASK